MKKELKKLLFVAISLATMFSFSSCSDDDDDENGNSSTPGKVEITDVVVGNKTGGKYTVKVYVRATGINSSDVSVIGMSYGITSNASTYRATGSGVLAITKNAYCTADKVYYFKGILKTSGSSEISSPIKRVKIPK